MRSKKIIAKKAGAIKKVAKANTFPVVAIGASAGGLEAVSELFKNLPPTTGMAFIYVQHLNPDHKSYLTSILGRITKMKVQEIEFMEHIEPNNVYIIPHNKEIEVIDGHIQLLPRPKNASSNFSIDILFSSLAITHKANVIGVILSGNGSDGTKGLEAIKAAGGITFVQDDSAQATSMPHSSLATGAVDYVLSPKAIAAELSKLSKTSFKYGKNQTVIKPIVQAKNDYSELTSIIEILHKETGNDFSHYKTTMIIRRIKNRMMQSSIGSIKEYIKLLNKDQAEIEILHRDLLINVTSFFRDVETFEYLRKSFLPKLLTAKATNESLRIWVPACSRGEEVYSLAMLLTELQFKKAYKVPLQIFATDLSDQAIHDARIGKYASEDIELISKRLVTRFFTKTGNHYTINKEIREMCVFAPHNILRDPPFFKMDLISCRNLLIYFDTTAQKKVLGIMHFALKDGGYLMLGKSESIGTASLLFSQANNKFKIYTRKKNLGTRKLPELTSSLTKAGLANKKLSFQSRKFTNLPNLDLEKSIDSVLLSKYMPACAVINLEMDILQFRGSTEIFLKHHTGKASLNILKMTRPEFDFELRNAIQKANKTGIPVKKTGIELLVGAEYKMMALEVSPLNVEAEEPLLLVVFTLLPAEEKSDIKSRGKGSTALDARKIKKLSEELLSVRAEINNVIELQEKAYEELQSANEEIVSSNEEFQTLNEELETSKEEIEATNEELLSTNQELKVHNDLLAESYNYSQTIIATIHEPMLILDKNLLVKSANKSFYKKFHANPETTEGFPLFELGNNQWNIPELQGLLNGLLFKNLHFENFEVTHKFPVIGEKVMLLNASRIVQKTHQEKLILLAFEDITERMQFYLREQALLQENIKGYKMDKSELEKAVKKRTIQLNDKNRELLNANKDLTSFSYISSHDLQEPLRKIQTFIGCLLEEENKKLSASGKRYLKRAHETARRMQTLLQDLLTYSNTRNKSQQFETTDLQLIFNEVKKDFKEEMAKLKCTMVIDKLCKADIIPFQIRQLMHNLISNSIKFSKKGVPPRITLNTKIIPGGKLKDIALNQQPGFDVKAKYCHIVFADNGIGFDPQYNGRIFEVFQRLYSQEQYDGTGMGLAICKRIVENHNGFITATGKINSGARFDIYLPNHN